MTYKTLNWDNRDGIATLTLNRPDKMNAFTVEMCAELEHVFAAANKDDSVRAIVVTGSGKAFCAGMDLSVDGNVFGLDEKQNPASLDDYHRVRDTGGRVALAVCACTKPIIAAVNGTAVGIGATMLLPMDIRLCSDTARFGFVFSRLGIVNEACSSFFLPRLVGLSKALQWLLRGHIFDAAEALSADLVSDVTTADSLLDEAYKIAREIADNCSAVSLALIRQMVYSQLGAVSPLEAHKLESLNVFHTSMADGLEGVNAFREKRKPRYTASPSKDLPPHYPWWSPDRD